MLLFQQRDRDVNDIVPLVITAYCRKQKNSDRHAVPLHPFRLTTANTFDDTDHRTTKYHPYVYFVALIIINLWEFLARMMDFNGYQIHIHLVLFGIRHFPLFGCSTHSSKYLEMLVVSFLNVRIAYIFSMAVSGGCICGSRSLHDFNHSFFKNRITSPKSQSHCHEYYLCFYMISCHSLYTKHVIKQ